MRWKLSFVFGVTMGFVAAFGADIVLFEGAGRTGGLTTTIRNPRMPDFRTWVDQLKPTMYVVVPSTIPPFVTVISPPIPTNDFTEFSGWEEIVNGEVVGITNTVQVPHPSETPGPGDTTAQADRKRTVKLERTYSSRFKMLLWDDFLSWTNSSIHEKAEAQKRAEATDRIFQ
jgi:hypothetical protein